VLSAWPVTGPRQNQIHPKKLKLAMAVHGESQHYRVEEIGRRHFSMTAHRCGLGPTTEPVIEDIISRTPSVIAKVGARLPKGFPEKLFSSVTMGLQKAAERIEGMVLG
jgi:serine/threonine-protein kinase HipA